MVNKNVINFYYLIRVERQTHSLHYVHVQMKYYGTLQTWHELDNHFKCLLIKMENDYTLIMKIEEIRIEKLQWSIFLTRKMTAA